MKACAESKQAGPGRGFSTTHRVAGIFWLAPTELTRIVWCHRRRGLRRGARS